jgi:hypothetical protein
LATLLTAGSFIFGSIFLVGKNRRRGVSAMLALIILILFVPGCGGGSKSSNPTPTPNAGTPTGTYNVLVTGSSGSLQSTTGFTLVLQ